jgi:hypothetical protein
VEPSKEGTLNLSQIQNHNAQRDGAGSGGFQLGGQQAQATFTLGKADAPLYLYPPQLSV